MHILWVIIIGFVAGIIARLLAPGAEQSSRLYSHHAPWHRRRIFATFIGQAIGWYGQNEGAGLIGAVVGALVVLFIWHRLVSARVIPDPADRRWL